MRNEMKRAFVLVVLLCTAFLTSAVAHEHGKHLLGTVDSISASEIVIKAAAGTKTTAAITPQTKFVRGTQAISAGEIKQGEKAIVHAKSAESGNGLVAEEIHVGAHKSVATQH